MSEITMRPIGLKLVFGAAVTLLLVSSVKQQWNSSQQRFARQVSPSNTQGSEHENEGPALETNDRTERIDANVEDNHIETILTNENDGDEISSENQLADSDFQQDEHREDKLNESEDILNQGKGEVPEYVRNVSTTMDNDESVDNSQMALPVYASFRVALASQTQITQQETGETEPEIPDYDTDDGQDPDWRSTKYADALYDDEEEEEGNSENDKLHLGDNVITENDQVLQKTYQDSDNSFIGNSDSKHPSLFSWFGLGNYFSVENKHRDFKNDGISQSRQDSNNYDTNQLKEKVSKISGFNSENSFHTDTEENETVGSSNMTNNKIYNEVGKITNDTNKFDRLQVETNRLQRNPTNRELPFGVNGIDVANYDDYDDEDDQTQTKGTEHRNDIEYAEVNSESDAKKADPEPERGFSEERNFVPVAGDDPQVLHFGNQLRRIDHASSSDFHITGETQHNQQNAQPLIYEGEHHPPPSNPVQLQSPSNSHTPQRILDLILANNFELSQSQQFLSKLRYYLHQNIHRIDQDVDPNSNKTGSTFSRQQAQPVVSPQSNTNNVLLSRLTAMREFDNSNTQQTENVNSLENNNNDIYESNTGDTEPFYDTIHTNNDVHETEDNRDYTKEQSGIITPLPEPAIYDNPRPLSESEFALYRTQPYNTNLLLTKSVSDSPVDVKFTEYHSETSNTILEQQQTNKQDTKREDESIPCPRQLQLARTTQPITALVSFSDSSTAWVRNMLEQLTGIETDSIYNIMAQLKSGNAESVYHMGRKIAIETHMASEKNFERAIVVIRNPFTVDANHRIFRPSAIEWQNSVLWNETYSTWLKSSLPVHVITFEDLVESPLTELMKLVNFLSSPDVTISYKCAMKVALDPPSVINDVKEITGIYHDDRRRINQNIDFVIQVALKKYPDIVLRLNSYKVLSGT